MPTRQAAAALDTRNNGESSNNSLQLRSTACTNQMKVPTGMAHCHGRGTKHTCNNCTHLHLCNLTWHPMGPPNYHPTTPSAQPPILHSFPVAPTHSHLILEGAHLPSSKSTYDPTPTQTKQSLLLSLVQATNEIQIQNMV